MVFSLLVLLPAKSTAANLSLTDQSPEKLQEVLNEAIKSKIKRGAYFILGISDKLKNSKDELTLLRDNIQLLEDRLYESNTRIGDLKSQLENLDELIKNNKARTRAISLQMAETKNAILILKTELSEKEEQLHGEVSSLDGALSAYYMQTNAFFDTKNGEPRLLAFLSSDASTGEILKENGYLYFLQNASQELADGIRRTQADLDTKKDEMRLKQDRLEALQLLLGSEQKTLAAAQESKARLLQETQGKQVIYETLLSLSKKEQQQVSRQIEELRKNYAFFQSKLDELQNQAGIAPFKEEDLFFEEEDDTELLKGDSLLGWPVSPALGLSAYYHDEAYRAALGIPHNAIDIRLEQGSKVAAAADGVISKVADNGFAYSYVIIAHPDKIITLYGHLSEIFVTEGEIVKQGQVIGLSGGIPGTKGAGWLTTGAHLHLEVFKDWQHVDPLEYLPLEYVPVGSLPEKYLKRLSGDEQEKVKR